MQIKELVSTIEREIKEFEMLFYEDGKIKPYFATHGSRIRAINDRLQLVLSSAKKHYQGN